MDIRIKPSNLHGDISVPASKSICHRAIICASLSNGKSTLSNISLNDDISATIQAMQQIGAHIHLQDHQCIVEGIHSPTITDSIFNCNESGSTLRFLIPIVATTSNTIRFIGKGRLLKRPMQIYQNLFNEQNLLFQQTSNQILLRGPLQAGTYTIPGNISSQFISGLLMALPLINEQSRLEVIEPFESKSYVKLTTDMLEVFGVHILAQSNTFVISKEQTYHSNDISIEGDYSQFAFFAVLASLTKPITLKNMNIHSHQGDRIILDFLRNAGISIQILEDAITVFPSKPKAQIFDLSNCPDLGPILCVLASFSNGTSHFIHAKRLRMKESDRIQAIETELKKWGVSIQTTEDTITIQGKTHYDYDSSLILDSHNDHRIAMAMTVMALSNQSTCVIRNTECINKSYPNFFDDIQKIHGSIEHL